MTIKVTVEDMSDEDKAEIIRTSRHRVTRIVCRKLIFDKPFWAAVWYSLKNDVRMGEGTAWTDGRNIVFDAIFVSTLTEPQLQGLILHELAHVVFMHHLRRGQRDGLLWNVAADYCINWLLKEVDGQELPDGVLIDDEYKEDNAEQAYNKLFKKYPPPPQGFGNPVGPCNGGQGGQSPPNQPGNQPPGVSGKGGTPTLQGWGEVRDAVNDDGKPMTDSEKKAEEQLLAVKVRQAINTARKQGKLPGSLRERFEGMLEPKVDWQTVLNQFLAERFPSDYSWAVFNTRRTIPDSCLPGRDGVQYARIAVAIDTSGSVSIGEIQQMCSEIMHCLDTYDTNGQGMEIDVMYCDTEVHHVETLSSGDMPYQDAKGGGGGTLFSPIMEEVTELEEEPAALIYMTDGHCDDFGKDPGMPVLWFLVGDYINNEFKPPFGTVSRMEINQE